MIAAAALRLPTDVDRRAVQVNALRGRVVQRLVAEHGRSAYFDVVLGLVERHGVSRGAALAMVRRARLRGDVQVDDDGRLVVLGEASVCAPRS